MRAARPLLPFVLGLLAACAEGPFVDQEIARTVEKPQDKVLTTGTVTICHNDATPWGEVEDLARESCAKYGYQANFLRAERWHCRLTAPHRALFACTLPGLVDEAGNPINPADHKAVEAWRKRTGQPVPKPQPPGRPG